MDATVNLRVQVLPFGTYSFQRTLGPQAEAPSPSLPVKYALSSTTSPLTPRVYPSEPRVIFA
jgi:hypothetical protein